MPEPEPKFGETFGFALFRQGLVSFAHFLHGFARFRPFFCPISPGFAQIRFRLFLPKFVRIRSFSFVVRMRRSLLPGQD